MHKIDKTKYLFIAIFFIIFFVWYKIITNQYKKDINIFLQNKEITLSTNLKVTTHIHKELANFIFNLNINRPDIINIFKNAKKDSTKTRELLFKKLNPLYKNLKKIGLRQLHFHLPNGNSFLRFHKPSRFGDNLLEARETVAYVASYQKSIYGFEEGKVFNGFRFVYPLFSEKNYIGSVEISYNLNAFIEEFGDLFPSNYSFIIKKDISDRKIFQSEKGKYLESAISHNYYVDKNIINHKIENIFKQNYFEKLKVNLLTKDNFILMIKEKNTIKTATFLAVKNPVTSENIAFIVSLEENPYIFKKNNRYHYLLGITFLVLLLIFLFIYREIKYRKLLIYKNLEQKKYHQEEQLKNAKFTSIGQLAAGITHEINTPLTYIKANFEMIGYDIEDLPDSDIKTRMIEESKGITNGINRLSNIIDSMREMSQKSKEAKERTNLYSTLVTALTMAHNRSKQISKIYLQGELFKIGSNKSRYHFNAYVQKQRIEQVWIIIINNALDELVKIEPFEKRKISIFIEHKKDKKIISIKDNAGGVNINIMPNIFEPFESTKDSSGMGVGLNIAKRIIEDQNGEIRIYNEKNGAVFEIVLKDQKC